MILDGRKIAQSIQDELKEEVSALTSRKPCLAVILVGQNPASKIYVKRKTEACQYVGIKTRQIDLPEMVAQHELLAAIEKLNSDPHVDGILVQMPLPLHINSNEILFKIDPKKDVDGFHPLNVGKLLIGDRTGFVPCTPLGIQTLLLKSYVNYSGKHVVIVGRSNIVGKPLAALLAQNNPQANATVTLAHSKTENLKKILLTADIIVAAAGSPGLIQADMVPQGAVVIDVGMNRTDGKLVGDVDYPSVAPKCRLITPVPGGVGPMTIAMLLSNTLTSFKSLL
jgi:methylenetetrahydrofolate dehydrogenase (NADP+)/methenyltetrahydrofolate cyclohydrolase